MFLGFNTRDDRKGQLQLDEKVAGTSECRGVLEYEPTPYEVVHEENELQLRFYGFDVGVGRDVPVVPSRRSSTRPTSWTSTPNGASSGGSSNGSSTSTSSTGAIRRRSTRPSRSTTTAADTSQTAWTARERAGADGVHLFGFSTAVPLAAASTALRPDDVTTLGLQGPALDFHAEGGMLDVRPLADAIAVRRFVDAFGNVPAPLYDAGFAFGRPTTFSADLPIRSVDSLDDPDAVARAGRVARWMADGPDILGNCSDSSLRSSSRTTGWW